MPLSVTSVIGNFHFKSPVAASSANTAPVAAASVQLLIGPRRIPGVAGAPSLPGLRRGPINNWTEAAATGAVLALDASTGEQKWRYPMTDVTDSGILTTAADVLFTGGREGYFHAIDARSGTLLWKTNLGAQIVNGPITYEVDGKQYVAAISGLSLCVFGLR